MRSLLLLGLCVAVTLGQEPRLSVTPHEIFKDRGSSVYATCEPDVVDPALVTELRWVDPEGNDVLQGGNSNVFVTAEMDGTLGLSIVKLEESDAGDYICEGMYAGNQHLRAVGSIRTYKKVHFVGTPEHQTAVKGTEALIKCEAQGSPAPKVTWYLNGNEIAKDDRHVIRNNGIIIQNIQEADEGIYRCRAVVKDLGDVKMANIQVEVLIKPEITTHPEDTSGVEKESVTMHCSASGKPPPEYSWVDHESLPLENREGYYVNQVTGDLTIETLKPEQSGTYRCTASNPAGDAVAEAQLKVHTKPKLERFENITVDAAKNAELRCSFSGDPVPTITFQKETSDEAFPEGTNPEDPRIHVSQETDDEGHSVAVMRIKDVQRSDDGLYTCTGTSLGGVTVGWGHITVQFEPTFEQQPSTEFWSFDQEPVNISCLATSIPNATFQWYLRNQVIPENDPNLKVVSLGPHGILNVHPVDSSYLGVYTCKATNILGSAQEDLSLKLVHKPGPIAGIEVSSKTATTVEWEIAAPTDNGGRPVKTFLVQFAPELASIDDGEIHHWTVGSTYSLDKLSPNQRYQFRFAAKNEIGTSEWSGVKIERMNEVGPPEAPKIYSKGEGVQELEFMDHYNLQWEIPLDNGRTITEFRIVYYQIVKGTVEGSWDARGMKIERKVAYPGTNTFSIKGLRPDTFYRIELKAFNEIGPSNPTELIIKTANDPNAPPTTTAGNPQEVTGRGKFSAAPSHYSPHTSLLIPSLLVLLPLLR